MHLTSFLLEFRAPSSLWLCVAGVIKGPKRPLKRPLEHPKGHLEHSLRHLSHFGPDKKDLKPLRLQTKILQLETNFSLKELHNSLSLWNGCEQQARMKSEKQAVTLVFYVVDLTMTMLIWLIRCGTSLTRRRLIGTSGGGGDLRGLSLARIHVRDHLALNVFFWVWVGWRKTPGAKLMNWQAT